MVLPDGNPAKEALKSIAASVPDCAFVYFSDLDKALTEMPEHPIVVPVLAPINALTALLDKDMSPGQALQAWKDDTSILFQNWRPAKRSVLLFEASALERGDLASLNMLQDRLDLPGAEAVETERAQNLVGTPQSQVFAVALLKSDPEAEEMAEILNAALHGPEADRMPDLATLEAAWSDWTKQCRESDDNGASRQGSLSHADAGQEDALEKSCSVTEEIVLLRDSLTQTLSELEQMAQEKADLTQQVDALRIEVADMQLLKVLNESSRSGWLNGSASNICARPCWGPSCCATQQLTVPWSDSAPKCPPPMGGQRKRRRSRPKSAISTRRDPHRGRPNGSRRLGRRGGRSDRERADGRRAAAFNPAGEFVHRCPARTV